MVKTKSADALSLDAIRLICSVILLACFLAAMAKLAGEMHWFIFLVMSITFPFQLSGIPYLAFFEPERWLKKLTGKKKKS